MKIIAWTYMIETESGLTIQQIETLTQRMKKDGAEEFVLFTNDVNGLLEASSVAHGYIDNDYYDRIEEVQTALAEVCNDWDNEQDDHLYKIDSEHAVLMLCDSETV